MRGSKQIGCVCVAQSRSLTSCPAQNGGEASAAIENFGEVNGWKGSKKREFTEPFGHGPPPRSRRTGWELAVVDYLPLLPVLDLDLGIQGPPSDRRPAER